MVQTKKLALLIDADNIRPEQTEQIIQAASQYGRITLKRAYGNWQSVRLQKWIPVLKHHAIKAVQQFDYVSGKNTTDIALVIDAVRLLYQEHYDGFVLASSDSDYTPLAIHLREAEAFVMGVGEEKSLDAFQRSCDVFVVLQSTAKAQKIGKPDSTERPKITEIPQPSEVPKKPEGYDLEKIHNLLQKAWKKHHLANGYTYGSAAGSVIKQFDPEFKPKSFGYRNLQALIGAFPEKYELSIDGMTFSYRCREKKPHKKPSPKTISHQNAILKYIEQNGSASRKELDQLLTLSASATRVILQSLIEDGIIVAEGNHINRVYKRRV